MSAIDDLKKRYFVMPTAGGSMSDGDPGLPVFAGSEVIPHIGGVDYFRTLKALLDQPDVGYVYLAGWWLEPDFELVPGTRLVDLLKAKSKAGVDVRVLGWVMAPEVLNNPKVAGGQVDPGGVVKGINNPTMQFVAAARTEPTLAGKALLNVLAHPAGAVHTKFVLVGRPTGEVGFTGGIDAQSGRLQPSWHDVQAEVRGAATQPMYDWYRALWNENQARSPVTVQAGGFSLASRAGSTPALPARTVVPVAAGTKHVQSGRTVPRMNFSTIASVGASVGGMSLPTNSSVGFAPDGLFELARIWKKGIEGAGMYIYIEDQSFSSDEVFGWINTQLRTNPLVKVVLVSGEQDPTSPNPRPLMVAMRKAINEKLLTKLAPADIASRVGFFMRRFPTVVHTKSTIVDDNWALIGSANHMRRSLYTDFEHSVAFADEAGTAVANYRRALFNTHLGGPGSPNLIVDVARWFAVPYVGTAGVRQVDRIPLPFTAGADFKGSDKTLVDQLMDVDSRDAWGTGLASLAATAAGAGN